MKILGEDEVKPGLLLKAISCQRCQPPSPHESITHRRT
jgi:hypothetical protein